MIEIVDTTKEYPKFTLGPINLMIEKGSITGLVGENGAGKTTLMSIILNRIKSTAGSVRMNGKLPRDVRNDIGYVLDTPDFHGILSSRDINSFISDIYSNWDEDFFFKKIQEFGIDRDKCINEMSRGMKTKTMLSIALAHRPRILILDELTSGLDPLARDDILSIVSAENKSHGTTILLSTHIIDDVDRIANEVILLHSGKVILSSPANQLNEIYQQYHVNDLDGLVRQMLGGKEVASCVA